MEHQFKYNAEQELRSDKSLAVVPIIKGKDVKWAALPRAEADPILAALRASIGHLNIELKKVRFAAFASEETSCFDAEVWVNGKKEGTAHNQGHGGPTDISPDALSTRLDIYGATLPRTVSEIKDDEDPTGFFTMQPDAEGIVDDLLEKHLAAKEAEKETKKLQRDLATRLIFTCKGEKGIRQTKKLTPEQIAKFRADSALRVKWNVAIMLNDLPFAEAASVFNANIKRVYR
jgi:hypothetical protein